MAAAAYCRVGDRLARVEIDDLWSIRGLGIGACHEPITDPRLVLGCFPRVLDIGLHLGAIGAVDAHDILYRAELTLAYPAPITGSMSWEKLPLHTPNGGRRGVGVVLESAS